MYRSGYSWDGTKKWMKRTTPYLFDESTMTSEEEACGHCPNSTLPQHLCCGVCQFEKRQCSKLYPGEDKSKAMLARFLQDDPSLGRFSPCELFQRIRGRTLYFMGDSQTWHFYYAAECFLRAFAVDGPRRAPPTTDPALAASLLRVTWPVSAAPICLELLARTRVCAIRVDSASAMVSHTLPALQRLSADVSRDVVVLNTGLHYRDVASLRRDLAALADWRAARGPEKRPAMVWMDVPPQHFSAPTGEWAQGGNMTCRPLEAWYQGNEAVRRGNHRNVAAEGLWKSIADARLATFNASVPLWDSHKPGECTHWCSPGAYHLWLHLLNKQLAESGIGNAPEQAPSANPRKSALG